MPYRAGDQLESIRSPEIERMNIAYMAVAMRDPNPVHTEDEFARRTGMPGVIAHGTFPLGYAGALLTRAMGFESIEDFRLHLTAPVFPHDQLTAEGSVQEQLEGSDEDRRFVLAIRVTNQDGNEVARGRATVIG